MPKLLDDTYDNGKIILIGDSGAGKTGAKAALVACGYKLRMIDTDKGAKLLKSLLTSPNYPYRSYMEKTGVNPNDLVSHIPIDLPVGIKDVSTRGKSQSVLSPMSGDGWQTIIKMLAEWRDGEDNFGPVTDWENDTVLDFDTLSTLADLAKYRVQDMNGRLGMLEDEHGRDSGDAQELVRRLSAKLTNADVRCNVILTSHITWVDQTAHAAQSPEARLRAGKSVDARGFPTVIGRATSPIIGKRWNDVFIVRREGDGRSAQRKIYTVPTENTDAKNSVWLESSYPVDTGLASIFAALCYKDPPEDFINHVKKFNAEKSGSSASASAPAETKPSSGFGAAKSFGR